MKNDERLLALEHLIDCINSFDTAKHHYNLRIRNELTSRFDIQILTNINGEYLYCGNGKYFDTAAEAENWIKAENNIE